MAPYQHTLFHPQSRPTVSIVSVLLLTHVINLNLFKIRENLHIFRYRIFMVCSSCMYAMTSFFFDSPFFVYLWLIHPACIYVKYIFSLFIFSSSHSFHKFFPMCHVCFLCYILYHSFHSCISTRYSQCAVWGCNCHSLHSIGLNLITFHDSLLCLFTMICYPATTAAAQFPCRVY